MAVLKSEQQISALPDNGNLNNLPSSVKCMPAFLRLYSRELLSVAILERGVSSTWTPT